MLENKIELRVRYAETDQMGYVYYGRYAEYLEMARTSMIRSLGVTYKSLEEDHGILLPVSHLSIDYKQPAFYDDVLMIKTTIKEMPTAKITFESLIMRNDELLAKGLVVLVFVDKESKKVMRCPDLLIQKLNSFVG